jgi:hypothetical protein
MEFLTVTKVLRRRKILLALGLLAAALLGLAVNGVLPSRPTVTASAGEAIGRALLDTRLPLIATTGPQGADTIVQRSVLLATLMGSDQMRGEIAERTGVPAREVAVLPPTFAPVSVYTLLPDGELPQLSAVAASETAAARPFVVDLVTDSTNPIITVGAFAPDAHQAARLVQATIATLSSAAQALSTTPPPRRSAPSAPTARSTAANSNLPPTAASPTLKVEPLGGTRSAMVTSSSRSAALGVAAAIGAFLLWCALLVIGSGIARAWKRGESPVINGAL